MRLFARGLDKDGSVWVDFAWTLAVDHRSCDIGTMHVYYEYDKAKDTLVFDIIHRIHGI